MRSLILGTGMYVPPNVVDNDRLGRIMDTTDEWIRQRTGIRERRYADPGTASSDLALHAAQAALADAGTDRSEVDYLIFATMTPDFYLPGSACLLQRKLGLRTIPSLDIRQQCAGFLYGLQLADAVIRSGQARLVLLVGAEVHASFMPYRSWDVVLGRSDGEVPADEFALNTSVRDRAVLFGDGAGAAVIGPTDDDARGLLDVVLHADGNHAERMWVRAGGSAFRPYFDAGMYERGETLPILEGRDVFRIAVELMPQAALEILERNGRTIADVDLLVMHQANLRINEAVQKRLALPDTKVFNNIERYGNTTAATIPIAFHEARMAGRAREGDLVCFVALGSGLNWGAGLYRC